eukprot:scaffold4655_cov115-Isochrysis_galbana.AAC.7
MSSQSSCAHLMCHVLVFISSSCEDMGKTRCELEAPIRRRIRLVLRHELRAERAAGSSASPTEQDYA